MFQHVRWSRHTGLLLKAGATENVEASREIKGEATGHILQGLWPGQSGRTAKASVSAPDWQRQGAGEKSF